MASRIKLAGPDYVRKFSSTTTNLLSPLGAKHVFRSTFKVPPLKTLNGISKFQERINTHIKNHIYKHRLAYGIELEEGGYVLDRQYSIRKVLPQYQVDDFVANAVVRQIMPYSDRNFPYCINVWSAPASLSAVKSAGEDLGLDFAELKAI